MTRARFHYKQSRDNGIRICEEGSVYVARTEGHLVRKRKRPRLIDLFCGAGGMTLGFTASVGHSFEVVWANDFNKFAVETYRANFGNHCSLADLEEILKEDAHLIPEADVVIGGPPCQGFSLLNKKRIHDPRKQLWRPFLDVVRLSGASIYVMENVPQLLGSSEHREIEDLSAKLSFKTYSTKLCAADYGCPQTRWRAFIIGCKFASPREVFPPKKTHYNPLNGFSPDLSECFSEYVGEPKMWQTVRDAISDLPKPVGTELRSEAAPLDLHFGRNPTDLSKKRYRMIPKEGMNRIDLQKRAPELTPRCWLEKKSGGTDLFGRLWWDRPSFTIRTEFYKPEKGRYLHPVQHRPLTHREAARLQTFPDDFAFVGTKIEIAKQIGNAVPPLLAARVADAVYALWKSSSAAS